jgi:hypothetical protein
MSSTVIDKGLRVDTTCVSSCGLGVQAGRADRAVDACAQLSEFAAAVDLARAHAPPVRGMRPCEPGPSVRFQP